MARKLAKYNEKRNFAKTDEPIGERTAKDGAKKKLCFAVQYHLARREHFDFRLEYDGAMLSWAVPKGPSYDVSDKRLAIKVEDHPLSYADFEGTIPKGEYGGGTVMLWDEGEYVPETDMAKGLKDGVLKFTLKGKRLKGAWTLIRLKGEDASDNWLLIKEKDGREKIGSGISGFVTGIRSGLTSDDIASKDYKNRTNPFDFAEVQLARLATSAPEGENWLFEIKYDGYRIVAYTEKGNTVLRTRNGKNFTDKFRAVAEELSAVAGGRAAVLDGELIAADADGRADFSELQNYSESSGEKQLLYMAFDILALDGKDLRSLPLSERKEILKNFIKDAPYRVRFCDYVVGNGAKLFAAAAKMQIEGIVGKKIRSQYLGGRNGDWIKLKCYGRGEFVLAGFTRTEKKDKGISSLILAEYDGGKLTFVGRAGTGLSETESKILLEKLQPLATDKTDLYKPPKKKNGEEIYYLKPELVAEVQYAERTKDQSLRQAVYKGLRYDKSASEVVKEKSDNTEASDTRDTAKKTAANAAKKIKNKAYQKETAVQKKACEQNNVVLGVEISSPDKLVYASPEIKKIDVINYYEQVSERMLLYAGERILSVVRCHRGVSSCFFKKHPLKAGDGQKIIAVKNGEGEESDYFYVNSREGFIAEAQLGTLEFHVWGGKIKNLDKPDMMVFDLDPDEGMALSRVREGAKDLKKVLDGFKLKSFLKTSGGKGYHIVVPFKPSCNWENFKAFARGVALLMEEKWPDKYTANSRIAKRGGKIYVDWARNGKGATSVAAYSLRARKGACVSMPISWNELDKIAPDGVDLYSALLRLKKADPWKGFYDTEQTFN